MYETSCCGRRQSFIWKIIIFVAVSYILYDYFQLKTGHNLNPTASTTSRLIVDPSRQSVFQSIYSRKAWGNDGNGSGEGSSLGYTTVLRKHLLEFVSKYNLSSMIDIPCGGMVWTEAFLKSVWLKRPFFKYTGMDITQTVVNQLQEKWKGNDRVTIRLADLASSLPRINADFVFTRDTLQHLSLKDSCLAIDNLINLGDNVKYVLIGTYPNSLKNTNVKTGQFYATNLLKTPFNLPEPFHVIKERHHALKASVDILHKHMYVYQMKDLQLHRCKICTAYIKRNNCP